MKKFIITWRQTSERIPGKPSTVQTFGGVFQAVTLPLAIGQWQAKCYINAEIVGVQLIESRGVRDGR